MPRGRPRKNPEGPKGSEVPNLQEVAKDLKSTIESAIAVLERIDAASSGRRTVDERRPKKVDLKDFQAPQGDMPAPELPAPAVVFKSKYPGFQQIVRESGYVRTALSERIVPPKIVEFEKGTARVTDEEDVARMRQIAKEYKKRGWAPNFIEVDDEIARVHLKEGTEVVHHIPEHTMPDAAEAAGISVGKELAEIGA